MNWIIDNKEWGFSGIGVSLLGVIATIFFHRSKSPHIHNIKASGNFSPHIHAQGPVTVSFGEIFHAETVRTSKVDGDPSQSDATLADKSKQENEYAHRILNSLVKGYSQRIVSATNEDERKIQKELFYNQMRTSKMYKEMPNEIFDLWINKCLVTGNYLTLVEFINSTQNDSFLNSLDKKSPYKGSVAFSDEYEVGVKKMTEADLNNFPSKDIPVKLKQDPYRILIVASKYITGSGEPLLHTMYVDNLTGI